MRRRAWTGVKEHDTHLNREEEGTTATEGSKEEMEKSGNERENVNVFLETWISKQRLSSKEYQLIDLLSL